jgi:hypothetical protein
MDHGRTCAALPPARPPRARGRTPARARPTAAQRSRTMYHGASRSHEPYLVPSPSPLALRLAASHATRHRSGITPSLNPSDNAQAVMTLQQRHADDGTQAQVCAVCVMLRLRCAEERWERGVTRNMKSDTGMHQGQVARIAACAASLRTVCRMACGTAREWALTARERAAG